MDILLILSIALFLFVFRVEDDGEEGGEAEVAEGEEVGLTSCLQVQTVLGMTMM